jgi:uncharacterized membrane protein
MHQHLLPAPLTPALDTMPHIEAMASMSDSEHRIHPVTAALIAQRAENVQLKTADAITTFAGSMPFVYIHAAAFGVWMLAFEQSPWPTLTLIVSLEAIFLSTFVLIGQNRQAAFQRAKADHDFVESELELKTNTEITRQIHVLTIELHRRVMTEGGQPPRA